MFIFIDKHNTILMRKKVLIKEAGFLEFIRSFFRAKSDGKEKQWISNIRKINPELGDKWADFDQKSDKLLYTIRQNYLDRGDMKGAAEIDKIIDKYK